MKNLKNKNLLIISNGYPNKSGSIVDSTFVKDQVDELSKYFNKIYVLVPTPYFPKLIFNLGFLKSYKNRLFYKNYKYKNIEVYYTQYFKLPNKLSHREFYGVKSIVDCISKNKLKFDIIHSHFIWPSGYFGTLIKNKYSKPLIVTGHGFDVYDFPYRNKFCENKYKFVLNNCDFFITVSKNNLKIANFFVNLKNKSQIIYNGFNELFKPMNKKLACKKLKLDINKKILLNVASYKVNIKNQINLINAIDLLRKKRHDFVLYLIGDGPDRQLIIDKIEKLKLKKFIKIIGSKPHSDIPLWMNASDLFILPSYFEGNPTVMFEVLGCGVPYIGTSVGGVSNIIISENYGLLFNNLDNYKKLFELINIALDKKWNHKEILKYANNFKLKNIVKKITNIYNKLN